MKLYTFKQAPNAQRVQVFIDEKNIEIERVEINVRDGEQFKEPFQSMNPFNCIPFLELHDGTIISETVSICRYLEELYPNPSLLGVSSENRALIDMWNRRLELDGFTPILHALRNKAPRFAGRVIPGTRNDLKQIPAVAERGLDIFKILLNRINSHLSTSQFVAGIEFSIADITGYFMMEMSEFFEIEIETSFPSVFRWHSLIKSRPSIPK
ncbi:MAG: hypothetical protein CBB68_05240 [Rhodospirillaceae bacterium TMED8]|nr:hypothetical protein [Magnetovibrio sp.]OUT51402.1 MAG: hypothetical protein CBB68_05240 [Rhodospirillaceae bacterium TMED8]|tara:strand:+ start:199 stop:831 length:633 start_codon:yes stop_codon:yes gene_type:complete